MLHTLSRSHQSSISYVSIESIMKVCRGGDSGLGTRTGIRGRFLIGDEGKGSMLGKMHRLGAINRGLQMAEGR
jgi:hypothetical protein